MTASAPPAVTDAVRHALKDVGIDDLHIDLVDGCIHLHGNAPSYEAKHRATECARRAAPSACIANDLRIVQMSFPSDVMGPEHLTAADPDIDDAQVAMALRDYVRSAANVPRGRVTVDFHDGVASLAGSVRSSAEAEAIEDLVRWHDHVTDVDNGLHVPRPGPARPARRVS